MADPIIKKDFYKLDVYRFDVEYIVNDWYDITVNNKMNWDYRTIRATKKELKGLADFIYEFLEKSKESC